ncbi:MAG TPA: DNA mismatch repair protein MutS [Segetibacter sp.]|jgi:DNA mismatch repair ATPase MutS
MQVDKTTISDLSIFHSIEEQSVLHHLDFTTSIGGREWIRHLLANPHSDIQKILETQETIKVILSKEKEWPSSITNGTIMVVDKFYDTPIADLPSDANVVNSLLFKLVNTQDFSLVKYSVNHFIDFTKGMHEIVQVFNEDQVPSMLKVMLERISMLLNKHVIKLMLQWEKGRKLTTVEVLNFGHFLRRNYKQEAFELIELYSRLDAYFGLAIACRKLSLVFPTVEKRSTPFIEATGLFHIMLQTPVAYNVQLDQEQNFLFLTGANMAGKSTFIKAVGVAVYLAHIGMGVPATGLRLSLFDGLLSNIQVEDNITKGESYFFNEVQRIKKTIDKINDGRNWLILIDELFKGTNVQDAMKCSTAVVEGLRKMQNALFILSTHLYEIGEGLMQYPNIQFRYFETSVEEDQLLFNYQLKTGISNDRLGYLILKREGVVNMLEKL